MRTVFFRPIASLTHAFDWGVLGERPWAMHLHSVLWYALQPASPPGPGATQVVHAPCPANPM